MVCDICGGILSMDASGEFAVCENCGMWYPKERLQEKVQRAKDSVEIATGNVELERLLKNAETFISLGKLGDEKKLYDTISKEYPGDIRGWWGHFTAYIKAIEHTHTWDLRSIFTELDYAWSAIKLCSSLEDEYINLEKELMEQADSGQIHFIWSHIHFLSKTQIEEMKTFLMKLPTHDIIRCRLLLGIEDAQNLRENFRLLNPSSSIDALERRRDIFYRSLNIIGKLGKERKVYPYEKKDLQMLYDAYFAAGRTIIAADEDTENSFIMSKCWSEVRSHLPEIVARCKKEIPDGCYIATAVYGSYDCPEVWTLRRFRDRTLATTWYGRTFIRVYYTISPTLVKWFGHTAWFKRIWKRTLDYMVNRLNTRGVKNTPYQDRNS